MNGEPHRDIAKHFSRQLFIRTVYTLNNAFESIFWLLGAFSTFTRLFHFVVSHLSNPIQFVDEVDCLCFFFHVIETIKLQSVSWNSLIGNRGLSRLVKLELGYMIITPRGNLAIKGHKQSIFFFFLRCNCFPLCVRACLHKLLLY